MTPDVKVGISLLTMNHLDWTKECLKTLEKHTPPIRYHLTILDNGSTDGTPAYLVNKGYDIILKTENIGIARGRNETIKRLLSLNFFPYICVIHNDMLFTTDWLKIMIEEINQHKKCLLLGCMGIIEKGALLVTDDTRDKMAVAAREDWTGRANLDPRLIRAEAFSKIGLYDEMFEQQDCEDVDFNKRVEDAGFEFLGTHKAVIWHGESIIRLGLPNEKLYIQQNKEYFFKKHNVKNFDKWNLSKHHSKYVQGNMLMVWAGY